MVKKITVVKHNDSDFRLKKVEEAKYIYMSLENGIAEKCKIERRYPSPNGFIKKDYRRETVYKIALELKTSRHKVKKVMRMWKTKDPFVRGKIFEGDYQSIYDLDKYFTIYQKKGIWPEKKYPNIYFFQDIDSGYIKIGTTSLSVEERHKQIGSLSPIPDRLIVLHSYRLKENYEGEKKLHKKFKKHRVLDSNGNFHGEWFYPAQEILNYIEGIRK